MRTFREKLSVTQRYLKELETAIFWHDSMMSWVRQANLYRQASKEYPQLLDHALNMVRDRKEARCSSLVLARKFKSRLEDLS